MIYSQNSVFSLILTRPGDAPEDAFTLFGEEKHDRPLSVAGRQAAGALFLKYLEEKNILPPDAPPAVGFFGKGKPYLPDFPDFHYNISHSGEYAAAAFSPLGEVGVDIQIISKYNPAVAKKCFCEADLQLLDEAEEQKKDALFTRLWTEYEAVLKVFGGGLLSLKGESYAEARKKVALFFPDAPAGYALCVAVEKNTLR